MSSTRQNLLNLTMVLGLGIFLSPSLYAGSTVEIKGSDTLINLVQKLAEVYMNENKGSYVSVTGGGSGTGIAAIINKKCDIADASRLMKDKEIKRLIRLEAKAISMSCSRGI